MNKLNLDELEALANAATELPWDRLPATKEWKENKENNYNYCHAASNAVPQLIARIRELEKALDKIESYGTDECPECREGRVTMYRIKECVDCEINSKALEASDEQET